MTESLQNSERRVFCPGCNTWSDGEGGHEGHCQRCGMPLLNAADTSQIEPTRLWGAARDSAAANAGPSTGDDEHRLAALAGGDLHIYHIDSLLGRGGMGWVFLARHRDLHRSCALKILAPRLAGEDPEYVARFENEGRAAAALVHPNIITTHAIGRWGDLHFLEMEFVRGRSLQQRIKEGPLSPLHAMSLAAQIAAGLACAHQEGILHRDLKPDNVLLTHHGIPKLSDFGLAKRIEVGHHDGQLAGTPHYMAPELFLGEPPTTASDVYALGVCLYVMLTGRYPFTRPRLTELMAAVTSDPLPHLRMEHPHIPLDVSECVFSLLSRSPANRPRDGIEALQLLQAVLGHARDIETLLHEALDDLNHVSWSAQGNRHVVQVELREGRRQRVFIETTEPVGGDRLLSIYSVCGPVDPSHCEEALQLNSRIVHGAIAIRDVDGRPMFVMTNNYPRSTADSEEIRQSVLDAALHADALEQRLTGRDEH